MEVDEARIAQAGPDARLEKPFDSETLRQLVQQAVPKTQSNPVSSYLNFPKMPEFSEERPLSNTPDSPPRAHPVPAQASQRSSASAAAPGPVASGKIPAAPPISFESLAKDADDEDVFSLKIESTFSGITRAQIDDLPMVDNADVDPESELLVAKDEDFASVPLQATHQREQTEEDGWTQQDLKKFKIQTPAESPDEDFATRFMIPQDELTNAHIEVEGEFEEIHFGEELPPAARSKTVSGFASSGLTKDRTPTPTAAPAPLQEASARDPALIERVIREEAREVIENICWKVIPEMVERIVREEINKILRETEKSL